MELVDELLHLEALIQNETNTTARALVKIIKQWKLVSVFPNIDLTLRLFLTLPVTNASGEWSF